MGKIFPRGKTLTPKFTQFFWLKLMSVGKIAFFFGGG